MSRKKILWGCVKYLAKGYLKLRHIVGARSPRPNNTELIIGITSAYSASSVHSVIQAILLRVNVWTTEDTDDTEVRRFLRLHIPSLLIKINTPLFKGTSETQTQKSAPIRAIRVIRDSDKNYQFHIHTICILDMYCSILLIDFTSPSTIR